MFSIEYIDEVSGGDAQIRAELIGVLRSQLKEMPEEIERLAEGGEYLKASRAAHTFKSTALSIGDEELAVAMKRLEIVCKKILLREWTGDKEDFDYQRIKKQMETLPTELDEWTEKNQCEESVRNLIKICKLQSQKIIEGIGEEE